ncbi:MAG: TIGR04282 family arsenosugar biosynthesis glycosyltransferase [Cyanobacteriota bacterium]|nr:TIGR04282 family arsenosugar biosynthesis glycosyltransferase [Cyanobacteriota bacterium]
MRERLIIFTRYPEPGKTKTRLIPVLGEEGAATLQRQMTEHKLAEVRKLQVFHPLSIEVHFAGGNEQLMQGWLGSNIIYRHQSEGDIGCRMASAFQASFEGGMNRVVLIGSDCPDLNAQLLAQAFQALEQHDLVLGPARDGGYYLIGLHHLLPELFTGISWSTAEVLQQTQSIAKRLELAVAYLPLLSDVDRPEDLSVWNSTI